MAGTSDKAIKDIKKQLDEFAKKADSRMLQKAIKEETKGIEGTLDKFIKETEIREQWRLATEQTSAFTSGLFEGLLGKDLGSTLAKKYAKANEGEVKKAQSYFKQFKDKGEKGVSKKSANIAPQRDVSFIKSQIVDIKQIVQKIERSMKPAGASKRISLQENTKSGRYMFDPRMAGGGRYRDVETGDLVSAKKALAAAKVERSDRVGKMISADEDPMIRFADTLDSIFKSLGTDNKTVHDKLDEIQDSVDMSGGGGGLFDDLLDIGGNRKGRRGRPKGRTRAKGRFGKGAMGAVKKGLGTAARVAGKVAAPLAVAMTAYDAYTGYNQAGEVLGLGEGEEATTGQKLAAGAGSAISGLTFGLVDEQATARFLSGYDPDEKRLINNWAYSVHIGKATMKQVPSQLLDGVKELLKNPPKHWGPKKTAPQISAKPAPIKPATATAAAGGATIAPSASMGAPETTSTAPSPAAPSILSTAASAVGSAVTAVKETVKAGVSAVASVFSGPSPALDKVTSKQSGVDTSGLDSGFSDRMARMASAFQSVTGKKLMITSGYRDDQKQLQLWNAKYAEMKAKNPQASEAELMKMTRKWVALPVSLGGRPSRHAQGIATDINSKGASGIDAINGMEYNGQKVTTDSFLAMFGLQRPLKHEPWHIQPLGDVPTPDNPDPTAKAPMVADATGKAVNLESGKTEAVKPEAMTAAASTPTAIGGGTPPASSDPLASMADGTAVDSKEMVAKQDASVPFTSSEVRSDTRNEGSAQVTVTRSSSTTTGPVKPVQNQTGQTMAQQSSQLASTQAVAQATPAATTVINNNSGGGGQQPVQAPKTPLPKASSRPTENAFNRALAKDFAHPTSFSSVAPV